ncbi:MAG: 4-(cytidine 5'-diphospho)-2-C-methyl-D-erythritol kinase [Lentisphaerae bacterium]|nr:4-(cytidine 5'-diphospho)-2-C-methyl-D-erythritol kinase [Lentisphaerota bacterium]
MEHKALFHAPAKINLLLRVTGKRSDGYHELVSLFHPVRKVCDEIKADLSAAAGISLCCNTPGVPADSSNLLWKAAAAFAEKMQINPCWHFELIKHIPAAAGMGGGSSDAGRMLRFLSEHFSGCSEDELKKMAEKLGADVPFFLDPQDAAVRGTGEKITPVGDLPVPPMLAVFPNFPVSAAWAYRHLQHFTPPQQAEKELQSLIEALQKENFDEAGSLCANDLEQALFEKFPLLTSLRRELMACGAACVHVSGSGSSLFAIFPDKKLLAKASEFLGTKENLETGIKIMEC